MTRAGTGGHPVGCAFIAHRGTGGWGTLVRNECAPYGGLFVNRIDEMMLTRPVDAGFYFYESECNGSADWV
ncbi:hypothetical protein RV134_330019 [Roseovarius sp. EC-HK134]|nr:hypothetical protein RV420_390019 [Roseovarius sp. EC-SD190]VVT24513.1 hypothetical protein RV134_330019 [Roseovarius sp. EC-HK134]